MPSIPEEHYNGGFEADLSDNNGTMGVPYEIFDISSSSADSTRAVLYDSTDRSFSSGLHTPSERPSYVEKSVATERVSESESSIITLSSTEQER